MRELYFKRIYTVILVVLMFLFQSTEIHSIEILGVVPNLLLCSVVCYSIIKGENEALAFSVICGILLDMSGGRSVGINAVLCTLFSFLFIAFGRILFNKKIMLCVLCTLICSLFYEGILYVFNYLVWGDKNISFALLCKIIPAAVYNGAAAFIVYPLVKFVAGNTEE